MEGLIVSRRQRILDAAGKLFERYGFGKTTVADIAREAGIGKGSVYLEFPGKEDVFLALVEEHEREILAEVRRVAARSGSVEARLIEVALVRPRRNVEALSSLPEVFEILATLRGRVADLVCPYQAQCVSVVADLLCEGVDTGLFPACDCGDAAGHFYRAFDVSFVFAMNGMCWGEIEAALRHLGRMLIHGLSGFVSGGSE
jgi:AcrR family transcriptional regulator